MILTPLLADASQLQGLEQVIETTGINAPQFFSQLVVFLVVAFVLAKFAFGPVQTILEQRRKTIEESLKNADKINKELAAAEAERITILQKANEQAAAIIAEAQKAAGVQGDRRVKEAAAQAEDLIRKAHEAAQLDRDRLMNELKQSVAALVVQTTEKVTGKVLNADDHNRLNAETVAQLGAAQN